MARSTTIFGLSEGEPVVDRYGTAVVLSITPVPSGFQVFAARNGQLWSWTVDGEHKFTVLT
jgi:hypothetical protein